MKRERVEQLVRAMVNAGYKDEQIAEELGYCKHHIQKIKRTLGLTVPRKNPQEDAEKMKELYKNGFTKRQIAEQLNWSYDTVARIPRLPAQDKVQEREISPTLVRRVIKPEMVIDNSTGKIYYDVTPFFLETEGMSVWNT